MDCDISRVMSKEMTNTRTTITWEQGQRRSTPLRAMWKSQKVISETRQRHSFHKKRFLNARAGTRERGNCSQSGTSDDEVARTVTRRSRGATFASARARSQDISRRAREAKSSPAGQRAAGNATRSPQQLLERRTDLAFAQRQERKHARDDAQMKRRFAASQVFAVDVNGEGGVG